MVVEEKKESYDLIDKKSKLVPPDGGWGYCVAIAVIIIFSTTTSFFGCFGMMFNDFIIEISMSSASVTLLMGIFGIFAALSSFLTSPLLRMMSLRKLAFVAAVIFSGGTLGTVIMTSAPVFFLCFGVLQGTGLGILYNLCCTLINDYFIEKRVLIMSIVQAATGLNAMIAPMFVKWLLEGFGSRATLLIVAGLSLQNLAAVLVMQPAQWHMKKVEIPVETEYKLLLEVDNEVKKVSTPVIQLTDLEENSPKAALEKGFDFPEIEEKKSGIRKILDLFIDRSLLKTFLFSCTSFGPALCSSGDGIYIAMLPQYFYSMGWTQENVAMAIALYGFGDLATRIVFMFISKWMFKLGIQEIYIIGVAIAVLSRIGMLCSSSVTAVMVYFALMGVSHCCVAVLMPLVISDAVAPEKFTSALGLCLLLSGILGIGLGPAVGAVRDLTNSYSTAFYTLTSFYAIIAILWPIELFIKKQRRKNVKENTKSSK